MCGIAGVFYKTAVGGTELADVCLRLSRGMRHRGPDDEGFVLFDEEGRAWPFGGDDSAEGTGLNHILSASGSFTGALVHRRLSVIAPGPKGHQPMDALGGRYWGVYNGETFNFHELDREYGFDNHSGTDAETAISLLAQNHAAHPLLDGFHALGIYDSSERRLELFRDTTGVKPLFYVRSDGFFAFCSETVPLRRLAALNTADSRAVFHFLTEGIQLPDTEMVSGIRSVGRSLSVDCRSLDCTDSSAAVELPAPGKDLRETLMQSVKSRLMSDVPLGFAVSGGLDSAIIIGAARKILGADADLRLFSVCSSGDEDESSWQGQVAKYNQAQWHSLNIEEAGPELLPDVVRHAGMPAVAWNNLAQNELARLAHEHGITVFLNGQGADEIFGGYPDYLQRAFMRMPLHLWKYRQNWPLNMQEIAGGWLRNRIKMGWPESTLQNRFHHMHGDWLGAELRSYKPWLWQQAALSPDEKMREDYFGQKLGQMLRWEDVNGMAHSLESRNPFADDLSLAAWLNVPYRDKIKNGYTKGMLRQAAQELVPESILWRTDKKGFTVPDQRLTWKHRHAWKDAYLSDLLDPYCDRQVREKKFRDLKDSDRHSLLWIFRLSSLAYFLEQLKNES